MTTPAERAWAAIEHIQANPDQHDSQVAIARHGDLITAGFAGRVCLLNGDSPDFEAGEDEPHWLTTVGGGISSVDFRARALLGFDPYDDDVELPETRADVEKMFGPRPAAAAKIEKHAARHAADEEEAPAKPGGPWKIVRHLADRDELVRYHRWEWLAELHAHWLSSHDRHRAGVHYVAYRTGAKS